MDAITAPLGLRLPDEARVWWGWSNGAPRHPSGLPYLPLEEAVDLYRSVRRMADDVAGGAPAGAAHASADFWWERAWFPITRSGHGSTVACDCGVARGEPTPIRVIDWENVSGFRSS